MKNIFNVVDERLSRFNNYIDKLYYAGWINLSELQSFRSLLSEIMAMFKKLRSLSFFGIMPWYVKKDLNRLNTELTLMEYNVSLISMSSLCAV